MKLKAWLLTLLFVAIPFLGFSQDFTKELEAAKRIAQEAGKVLVEVRNSGEDLQIENKNNDPAKAFDPVTIADLKSNEVICNALAEEFPTYGLLTEEKIEDPIWQAASLNWQEKELVWMIDPLDGTAGYTTGKSTFGVHIGLTQNGHAVLGVNYYPLLDTMYWAVEGEGAFKQTGNHPLEKLDVKKYGLQGIKPLRSGPVLKEEVREIYETILQRKIPPSDFEQNFDYLGSMGFLVCNIAEGKYNLYLGNVRTCGLWDFASSEVILREAGGYISDKNGNSIDYRSSDGKLNQGIVITGNEGLFVKTLDVIHNVSAY